MIVKRTVFAMQEVTAENGYEEIMKTQAMNLGKDLYFENQNLEEKERKGTLKPEIKENWLENMMANYVQTHGEEISFNTDLIVFEKDVLVKNLSFSPYVYAAFSYMEGELGKNISSRNSEYINFMKKLLGKYTDVIHFKVLKICGKEYSLFTF